MTNNNFLKILFVEDIPTDMELAEYHLQKSGLSFISMRVEDEDSLLTALNDFQPHLVISDYSMPVFDGMRALKICLSQNPRIPVIILTGSMNEQTAVNCLKAGAIDYVIKEHMMRLPYAVKEALEHTRTTKIKEEAEEALIRSEASLKSLLDNSLDRIWAINKNFELITGNAIFHAHVESVLGIQMNIGTSVLPTGLPENYRKEWKGYWDRVFQGEHIEFEMVSAALKPKVIIEYHLSPLKDNQGVIFGGVATGHDITSRKNAENKLKEQEEELEAIFENSPIMLLVVDEDRKIIKVNGMLIGPDQSLEKIKIGKRIGEALRCIREPESKEGCGFGADCQQCRIRAAISETLSTGVSANQLDINLPVIIGGKEEQMNILMSTSKLRFRNKPMVLVSMLDITEKKNSEQLLLQEQSLLRTLIDNLPDRIFFKDRFSRFVIANEGVAKHIGTSTTDELIGKSDFDFYPAEHASDYFEGEQKLILSGTPLINHEEPARDGYGNLGWTLTSKIPVKDENGQILGLVGISRDITEFKRTNEELLKAKNLAEQSNQLKDAFIANISHEIRTPLNSILGFTDLVKESFADFSTSETDNYFDIIDQSSQRLMRTVDMILSMSRIQIGDTIINPQSINLENLIERLLSGYSIAAKKKSLILKFDSDCKNSFINSDEYCVTHSISNLIDNAIKYTKTGWVAVRLSETSDNFIRLEIEDTGIGISEDYKSHLFNPYSQEENGISRSFEGIGLGLSLTRRFLENIQAEITVKSERGKGSVFTVFLPRTIHVSDLPLQD